MVDKTPNHELNKYQQGETNWDHSDDMATIEERLVIRDTEANRPNYEPHQDATFRATDTGAVYDGDGSNWNKATRAYEALDVEKALSEDNWRIKAPYKSQQLVHNSGSILRKGNLLGNMADLSGWSGSGATVSADTSIYYREPQSMKIEASAADNAPFAYYEFNSVQDFSDVDVSARFRIEGDDSTGSDGIPVRLTLNDQNDDRVQLADNINRYGDGFGWIRTNGGWRQDSDPDLTDIYRLAVQSSEDGGTVWVDEIRTHPKPERGSVLINFDGIFPPYYDDYLPIFNEYGLKATCTFPTERIDRSDKLSLEQIHEMQSYGWEFGAEMTDHTRATDLSEEDLHEQMRQSREDLLTNGLERASRFFQWPSGDHGSLSMDVLSEYYYLARTTYGTTPMRTTVGDPYRLPAWSIDNIDTEMADAKEQVDLAEKHRQTTIFYGHESINLSDLDELLDYITQADVDVIGYSDLWDYQTTGRNGMY